MKDFLSPSLVCSFAVFTSGVLFAQSVRPLLRGLALFPFSFLLHPHNYNSIKSGLAKQQHFKKPHILISKQSFPPTSSPISRGVSCVASKPTLSHLLRQLVNTSACPRMSKQSTLLQYDGGSSTFIQTDTTFLEARGRVVVRRAGNFSTGRCSCSLKCPLDLLHWRDYKHLSLHRETFHQQIPTEECLNDETN